MVAAHEEAEEEEDDTGKGVRGNSVSLGGLPCVEGGMGVERRCQGGVEQISDFSGFD